MTERRSPSAAHTPLSPDEIVRRSFSTAFRGFDPTEVRDFLVRLSDQLRVARSREEELLERIADLEEKLAEPPVIDEAMITAHLGEETAQIVRSAHEAAMEMRHKAETELRNATEKSDEIRAQLRSEADEYASFVREAAERDSEAMLAAARDRAQEMLTGARGSGRSVLEQAHDLRTRVLEDLLKRRRLAYAQVEQLLAGRDHLLEAVEIVRSNLDEMTSALHQAESDARIAAEAARDRLLEAEEEGSVDELESELGPVVLPESLDKEVKAEFVAEDELISEERRSNSLMIVRRKRSPNVGSAAKADESAKGKTSNENGNGSQMLNGHSKAAEPVVIPPRVELSNVESGNFTEGITILPRDYPAADNEVIDLRDGNRQEPQEVSEEPEDVETLFAQMRADREKAVREAERILAEQRATHKAVIPEAEEGLGEEEPIAESELADSQSPGGQELHVQQALERREEALAPLFLRFSKQIKRVIQDEQNEVLDAIRNQKGRPTPDSLTPEDVHHKIYAEALYDVISSAFIAGLQEMESGVSADVVRNAAGEATQLIATEYLAPMRRKLSQAIVTAPGNGDDVERGVLDAVSAVYRDAKANRVDVLARDILCATYTHGIYSGADQETKFVWAAEDLSKVCAACAENAEAEPQAGRVAYRSGHLCPPSHPGCRCLLVTV